MRFKSLDKLENTDVSVTMLRNEALHSLGNNIIERANSYPVSELAQENRCLC